MRPRFPLYAKILAWFFLNLVLLAGVFVLLVDAQFPLNLDWLLASGARDRFEAVRGLIVGELNTTPPDDWTHVLQRYGAAYGVQFALFDDEAKPLIGAFSEIPAEVRDRILAPPPPFPGPGRGPAGSPPPEPPRQDSRPEGQRRWRWRPPVRALLRTTNPKQYWLLSSARLDNPQAGDPLRVILIARSSSLSGGGLILDTRPWFALAGGAFVFSLLFWLPLVRGMTRTIGGVTAAARQIADGRFDVRVPEHRRDELGLLGSAINEMASRLDGFVKGQKRFLGDIAHELCSPLAKLQMALGVLEQRLPPGQEKYAHSAAEKAQQIAVLVNELLSFSKASFGPSAVRLTPVRVRDAAEEARRREECDGADIRIEVPEQLTVPADRDILVRALSNLIRNACRYAANAGPITVSAQAGREFVNLSVTDRGPGVPDQELTKIFDAFYRVDTSRTRDTGGVGLGLTIVKTCVESCRGIVTANNRPGGGLEVTLRFPVGRNEKSVAAV